MRTALSIAVGTAVAVFSTAALAQDTGGQVGGTVEPPKVTTTTPAASTVVVAPAAHKDDGVTDHEKVVGKFGVGYFGISQLPIGEGAPAAVGRGSLSAPVIGVRYWISEKLGLDLGIGFAFQSQSTTVTTANVTTTTDGPAALGGLLHGGLPLAFAYGKHYKFLLVPELNVGFTTRTEKIPNQADIGHGGLLFDLGARIGSEIQFGFIGVPELALQASVGLAFRHTRWSNSQDAGPTNPQAESSDSQSALSTTVQSDPWALFTNNISAIYYFP